MKIIVACGSGVATSTVIASRVEEIVKKLGFDAQIIQCSLHEVPGCAKGAALVVTSMGRLETSEAPVVVAFPYITGVGAEETDRQIEEILKQYQADH